MRKISTPVLAAIVAPATLALAACGGSNEAEETATGETAEISDPAAEFPAVPADARSSVEWAGTYEQRAADGRLRTLALADGDSYTMTDAEGVETTGTFNWYSDNSRILISEGETDMVFAVADGAIYELSGPEAGVDGSFDDAQTWRESITIEY